MLQSCTYLFSQKREGRSLAHVCISVFILIAHVHIHEIRLGCGAYPLKRPSPLNDDERSMRDGERARDSTKEEHLCNLQFFVLLFLLIFHQLIPGHKEFQTGIAPRLWTGATQRLRNTNHSSRMLHEFKLMYVRVCVCMYTCII